MDVLASGACSHSAIPWPGCATASRSVPATTSRTANAIGLVSNTTACGGPGVGALQPQVPLVESGGTLQVANLQ